MSYLNPIHHWYLNDGTTSIVDYSGNATGTAIDCVLSQTGHIENSIEFTGSSSYIESSGNIEIEGDAVFSIMAWFKVNSLIDYATIVGAGNIGVALKAIGLVVMYNGAAGGSFAGGNNAHISAGSIIADTWYHLAVTKKAGAIDTTTNVYLNGVNSALVSPSTNTPNIEATNAYIGNLFTHINGNIEDVRIYDKALTDWEIKQIYNEGAGTYRSEVIEETFNNDNLLHHWKLNDATTTIQDYGSNQIAGSAVSCVLSQTGIIDKSIYFNGSNSNIQVNGGDLTNNSENWSLTYWISTTQTGIGRITSKQSGATNTAYLSMYLVNGYLLGSTYNAGITKAVTATTLFSDGTWRHVAYTRDADNFKHSIYVDGILENSAANSFTSLLNDDVFFIGSYSGAVQNFDGNLEDIRIYDKVLSPREVKQIYNYGAGTYNQTFDEQPIHHWKLNDYVSQIHDYGLNPVTGTANNCILSQTGHIERGIEFTGSAYIDVVGLGNDIHGSTNFSFSFWMYPSNTADNMGMLNIRGAENTQGAFKSAIFLNNLYFSLNNNAMNLLQSFSSANQWSHIAGTYDGVYAKTFINGEFKTQAAYSTPISSSGYYGKIGNYYASNYFDGRLEDIRIYDRALTSEEVVKIYNRSKGTYQEDLSDKRFPTYMDKEPIHQWRLNDADNIELVTEGSFDTSTSIDSWSTSLGSRTWDSGGYMDVTTVGYTGAYRTVSVEIGETYLVTITRGPTAGSGRVYLGHTNENDATYVNQSGQGAGVTRTWKVTAATSDLIISLSSTSPDQSDMEWAFVSVKLSEASITDYGRNPQTGTSYQCSLSQTGLIDKSTQFLGGSGTSYIDCGSNIKLGTNPFTTMQWIKTSDKNRQSIMGQSVSTGNKGWYLDVLSTGALRMMWGNSSGAYIYADNSNTTISDGGWHHVVGQRSDGSNIKLWVDGVENTNTQGTSGSWSNTSVNIATITAIGKQWFSSSADVTGYIEDARIYDYALSTSAIQNIYNKGLGTYGKNPEATTHNDEGTLYTHLADSWDKIDDIAPLHHWTLSDGGVTTVMNDRGTNPIVGSITSCVLSQTGKIDLSCRFTGTASWISCQTLTAFTNTNFSFAGWINPTVHTFGTFISFGNLLLSVNSVMTVQANITGFAGTSSTLSLTGATWQHLVFTQDNSNAKIYFDGKLDTNFSNFLTFTASSGKTVIGALSGTSQFYDGYLEDIRLYNRVLTEAEISAIYNDGRGTYEHSYKSGFPTAKEPIAHFGLQELTYAAVSLVNNAGTIKNVAFLTNTVNGVATGPANIPYSYQFTGTTSLINAGGVYQTASNTSMGLSCWINTTQNAGSAQTFFYHRDLVLSVFLANKIYINKAGVGGTNSTAFLTSSTWYHVAYSQDSTGGQLYVNGALNFSLTAITWDGSISAVTLIGAYSSTTQNFNGYISDVRLYDYPLSADEVRNLYNGGNGTLL